MKLASLDAFLIVVLVFDFGECGLAQDFQVEALKV